MATDVKSEHRFDCNSLYTIHIHTSSLMKFLECPRPIGDVQFFSCNFVSITKSLNNPPANSVATVLFVSYLIIQ